jgi:2-polyprenyl-3-methyl-5-hydroxy-6-metoxy-1,4-benzoquinol methylase
MISDAEFLATELSMGISIDNPAFRALAMATVDQVSGLGIKTVLDFGAGTGVYSDAYHKAGYDIKAFEIFKSHRDYMAEKVPHIEIIDKPITTDLLSFIETAEHMTDKELKDLFKKIQPKYILFSSTSQVTDNDEAWGHINIKQQDQWDSFFNTLGYQVIKPMTYPTNWTKLYGKR